VKHLNNNTEFGKKYNFYRKGQFTVNFQAVRSQKMFNTLNIEIAEIKNNLPNWKEKISFQLSELDLFSVFFKIQHEENIEYTAKYHGEKNNKSLKISEVLNSGCKIELSDGSARKNYYFTCSPGEWYYAKLLICEQMLGHGLSMSESKALLPKRTPKT